jgi:RNA polymerase sigma factor (sigma-70 family)
LKPNPRTNDLLDRHGAFVRRLASQLTRCEADADDLAQSTWTEALVRPPLEWVSPRGWLARVTHRLAAKGRRSERRRTRREEQVARVEQVDADMDLSLVLGEMASALGDLDADQRRVLIGRHFEGLELRALAAREQVGLTTIKARLAAAHEALRQRLDRAHGGDRKRWIGALMPLTLMPLPAPPVTPTHTNPVPASTAGLPSLAAGVLAVSTSLKSIVAIACVGALVIGLVRMGGASWVEPELAPLSAEDVQEDVPVADVAAPETTAERTVAAAQPTVADELVAVADPQSVASFLFDISDLYGAPAEGVTVFAAPKGLPLNQVGSTNKDGEFRLTWEQEGSIDIVVGVKARGSWIGGLRRMRIGAGQTRELIMSVHPDLLPRVSQGSFSEFRIVRSGFTGQTSNVFLSSSTLSFDVANVLEESADSPRRRGPIHPHAELGKEGDPIRFSAHDSWAAGRHRIEQSIAGRLINISPMLVSSGISSTVSSTGTVEGIVQDAAGLPVAHVRVLANRHIAPGQEVGSLKFISTEKVAYTDSEGRFSMDLSEGDYSFQVGSSTAGKSGERVHVAEGAVVAWNGFVDTGLCLTGQVALPKEGPSAEGEPEDPQFMVEASVYSKGGLWVGVTTTVKDGYFLLPHCPANSMAVDISLLDDGKLMHHEVAATAGVDGWRVPLEKGQLTKVTWRPLDDAPGAPCAAELLVWDAQGGRGRQRYIGGHVGEEASVMLPEGAWILELATAGAVRSDDVRVDVLKGLPVDLGPISMGPVGWLMLPASEEGEAWTVRAEPEQGPDYLAFEGQVPMRKDGEPMAVALVPGDYRVFLTIEGEEGEGSTELDLGTVRVGPSEHRRIPPVRR